MAQTDTILVTGAAGFIGSHLVEELLRRGERVRAFVRYTSHGGIGWLDQLPANLRERCEAVFGDVADSRAVLDAMRGCKSVYHLAALIGIPYSYLAPASYVQVNVNGTLNVLEAARTVEVGRVVIASTSEVYGTALRTPIDEDHPIQAQSPYAATKVAADQLALSYHRSFGLQVAVVRPFNTYGPRQSTRAVIPAIVSQTLCGDAIHIGCRSAIRDMVFVHDTANGFIAAGAIESCVGQVTNLATGIGVTVGELIERITGIVGRRLPIIETEERKRPPNSEVLRLIGSGQRAMERTGWRPRVSLEEGLRRTVAWFREHGEVVRGQAGKYRV